MGHLLMINVNLNQYSLVGSLQNDLRQSVQLIADENPHFQIFKGHVDLIHTTNVQNLSHRLKVNEFC